MICPPALNALPGVVAGFTTRAFSTPDEPIDDVRRRAGEAAGFEAVASVGQVHEAGVATVRAAGHVPAHDGLVTDRRGLLLTVVAADCALLLMADPEAGVVGACHSGWRGTVAGVAANTVAAMQALGAEPARIRAWIAPCISAEAFEVGEEVAAAFPAGAVVRRADWPRPHVDLRAALRAQLTAAGLAPAHVEVDAACPALDTDRFYSYRAEGGTKGRMIGFVGMTA